MPYLLFFLRGAYGGWENGWQHMMSWVGFLYNNIWVKCEEKRKTNVLIGFLC